MPKCSCSGSGCSCLVRGGGNIKVTGTGAANDPYVVSSDLSLQGALRAKNTPTLSLTLAGSGLLEDPYILSGAVTVGSRSLTDFPDGAAPNGYTLVAQDGRWVYALAPASSTTSVNVGEGLRGAGTTASLLRVATSGTWGAGALSNHGSDSRVGSLIYVDADGSLRGEPAVPPTSMDFNNLTNVPSSFRTRWNLIEEIPASIPTSWDAVLGAPELDAGRTTVTLVGGQAVEVGITFDTAFSAVPSVHGTLVGDIPAREVSVILRSRTSSGATFRIYSPVSGVVELDWMAGRGA